MLFSRLSTDNSRGLKLLQRRDRISEKSRSDGYLLAKKVGQINHNNFAVGMSSTPASPLPSSAVDPLGYNPALLSVDPRNNVAIKNRRIKKTMTEPEIRCE